MKKVLYIVLAFFALVVLAAVLVPVLFKDKIKAKVEKQIAQSVDAHVQFNDFGLSVFHHFPNITISLDELGIVGKGDFEGDTLAHIGSFRLVVDMMSVISGDQVKVRQIDMVRPRIQAIVLENGKANWDITIQDTTKPSPEAQGPSEFKMSIDEWQITDGYISYLDKAMPMHMVAQHINHNGSGDFAKEVFDMESHTEIGSFFVVYDSVNYINNKKLTADMVMNLDLPQSKYTFKENTFKLNDFTLGFDGFVQMPDNTDDIITDVTFQTKETSFKSFLSLIPAVYTESYADLKTDGNLAFKGFAKGIYNAQRYPNFGIDLKVDKAMMQYPKLPSAITNINLDMVIDNPTGILDSTVVDIKKIHMNVGKNPVDGRLWVKGLTNYLIDADFVAKLDLAEVTAAFPVEGTKLKGLLGMDVKAKGEYNDSLHRMPVLNANLNMIDGYAKSKDFPAPIENINFQATINSPNGTPEATRVKVDNFSMLLEGQPFTFKAAVENLSNIVYDVTLKGTINLATMTKIFPIEGTTLAGKIKADIATKGRMADVDAKRYDKLPTSGTMQISNLNYLSKDLPQGMKISTADLSFNPQNIRISNMKGSVGKSDMLVNGTVSNYLAYALKNETLQGNMTFSSNRFDVNEWMTTEEAPKQGTQAPSGLVEIPKNVDFNLAATMNEVLYQDLILSNAKGNVILRSGTARLDNFRFNTLGGAFAINGFYDPTDLSKAKFDMGLDIQNVLISQAYEKFVTIRALAPFAQKMNGSFSTNYKLSGLLDKNMSPVFSTLGGGGIIKVANGSLNDFKIANQINSLTKMNLPTQVTLKDLTLKTQIQAGRLVFQPFDFNVANTKFRLGGSNGFDGTINYDLKTIVPAGAAGATANNVLSKVLGQPTNGSQNITLNFNVGGTQSSPKLKLIGGGTDGAKSQVQDIAKNKINTVKKDVEDRVKTQMENARKEAELKAQQAKEEAERRAKAEEERLKKEAEDRAKKEVDKLKDRFKLPR